MTDARKSMTMYNIVPGYNSATVYYHVNDPYGELGDAYFRVTKTGGSGESFRVSADIDGSQLTIYGGKLFDSNGNVTTTDYVLEPNTRYRIEFMNTAGTEAMDIQYFMTSELSASIFVTSMSQNSVSYMVRFPQDASFDTAEVWLTKVNDSTSLKNESVDVAAASGSGATGTISHDFGSSTEAAGEMRLMLANVTRNGAAVELNTAITFSNPYVGKTDWDAYATKYVTELSYVYTTDSTGTNVLAVSAPSGAANDIQNALDAYNALSSAAKNWGVGVDDRLQKIVSYLTATKHTVTFASNGGTTVSAQTIVDGQTAVRPVDPSQNGYTFAGWCSDSGLNTQYDFTTPVTADITLYAKWTPA